MRKLISILFVVFLVCFNMSGCGQSSEPEENYVNYDYDSDIITEDEAESKATSALYIKLKALNIYDKSYDVSQTRYSIGSITGSASSGYTVNGTYSLYDKYGNFKERENFSVRVDSDGHTTVKEY